MNLDLNFLLERKPEFYGLTRSEQVKYLAFLCTKNKQTNFFVPGEVKALFEEFNLVIPTNFSREVLKLRNGKVPVLIPKGDGFSFHPFYERELAVELFTDISVGDRSEAPEVKKKNTEIFGKYDFHPDVKRVAFSQFQDGYYKEAVQNAFVEVIMQTKNAAGNPKIDKNGRTFELDGDDLMNRVFGCDNGQVPIIAFNNLTNNLDKAEQRGIMYLFKGVVGVRDKKAHLNFIQNDPEKTIEYLSLASLLLRLLGEAKVSRSSKA